MYGMRISTVLLTIILAFCPDIYAGVKIVSIFGNVSVRMDGVWREAKTGDILAAKDKIKTVLDGRAVLLDGESRIMLRENSEFEVTASAKEESVFSLLSGKLRAMVKISRGAKFMVNTPVSVASVRGTDFVIDSGGELLVFEGSVEFGDLTMTNSVSVNAGNFARLDESGVPVKETMTPEQMQSQRDEWESAFKGVGELGKKESEEKTEEKAKNEKQEKANNEITSEIAALKSELREIVGDIKSDIVVTRDFTNEIKQADIASGRTMRDRFGNLVRVEQRMLRPQPDTMQFVNITKRDSYKYNGFFSYSGDSKPRIDIFDAQIKFSKGLPDAITEWPKFFQDRDDIELDKIHLKLTNSQDTIEMIGKFDASATNEDDEMKFTTYINGWMVNNDYNSVASGSELEGDRDEVYMWGKTPEIKLEKDGEEKYVSIWTEGYAINNSGGLLTKNSFAGADPFTLMKEIAFQNVIFVKEIDHTLLVNDKEIPSKAVKGDFFSGGNIDLIFTPDIIMAIATKIGPHLPDLMKSSDKNGSNAPRSLVRL